MSSSSFMRRTRTLMRRGTLRNLVSDSMAIDMGLALTIISVRGLAPLFDEPLLLRRVARKESHTLLDAETSSFES